MRLKLYYILSVLLGLSAPLLSMAGASMVSESYIKGARLAGAGHPAPLAFFAPLMLISIALLAGYVALSLLYAVFALPSGGGKVFHFFVTLFIFCVSLVALPMIVFFSGNAF